VRHTVEKLSMNVTTLLETLSQPDVATLALGSRPRQGVARLRESKGKKPGSQKEGSLGAKAKALEGCEPRGNSGVITYSQESKEVRGSVRE
jgi:hypothetical protein